MKTIFDHLSETFVFKNGVYTRPAQTEPVMVYQSENEYLRLTFATPTQEQFLFRRPKASESIVHRRNARTRSKIITVEWYARNSRATVDAYKNSTIKHPFIVRLAEIGESHTHRNVIQSHMTLDKSIMLYSIDRLIQHHDDQRELLAHT